jgi:CHAT domain-containing protein
LLLGLHEAKATDDRLLIAPMRSQLASRRRLILVPHGPLHLLPFAALRDGESRRYLIEDHELTYVPSASALPLLAARRTPFDGRVVVLGDPGGSLPSAAAEAKAVAGRFGVVHAVRIFEA